MHFWQRWKIRKPENTPKRGIFSFTPVTVCRTYALLLALLLCATILFRHIQEEHLAKRRQSYRAQAQMLADAGFYAEAQKELNRMPKPLLPEDAELLFQVSLKKQDFRFAANLLSSLPEKDLDVCRFTLIDALQKQGKSASAWNMLCQEPISGHQNQQQALAVSLLQDVQETPIQASFVGGWYHKKAAIMKDEDGFFLVGVQGEEIGDARYEALRPVAKGFSAKRKGVWIMLSTEGDFLHTASTPEEKDVIKTDDSFLLTLTADGGRQGYAYQGQEVIAPIYDRASPISVKGIGFAEMDGRSWQIRFRALRDGMAFNRIES